MKEAKFYYPLKNKIVQCVLCPHYCVIQENEFGKCKVRKNINGKLYSLSYEQPVSLAVDPIEKKPLYHFLPGTKIFSIGMAGCNLKCLNCQNWQLSQCGAEELKVKPVKAEEIVKMTWKSKCPSIAYTYSEPYVSWEYVYDMAKLAKKDKIRNITVTNGFINPLPLKKLLPYIDASNIDLKSINEKFYENNCQAKLKPVLESIKIMKKKIWIELTNLIIPGLNDSEEDIFNLVLWIRKNLGRDVPLHFSAFHPCYKLSNLEPTNPETIKKARKLAIKEGLNYVYTGNIGYNEGNNTYCPNCKKAVIIRYPIINKLINGKCSCGEKIPGVWE